MRAVRAHNAELGRVIKNPKVKNLPGCPKQPGGTECGYAVMRFMKDLVEDPDMKLLDKWAARSRKTYSKADLDIVRLETLDYIQSIM
uniref:Ubiquitin-like protease family profile domain-containing protein n=1 Tax=Daucus carota subsp. sativus TaxID=79200 RepID=A0A166CSR0_DAUCS